MDTNRLPKQALQCKPNGRRNVERPRKRWRDQLHLEDQGTGNTPKPSWTWWWWWWHLCSNLFLPFTKGYLNGCWQCHLWRVVSIRLQLRANNRFAWLTNVPKMVGHKFCRVIVNRCYERHKEIRSLDILRCVVHQKDDETTQRARRTQEFRRIFSGNLGSSNL